MISKKIVSTGYLTIMLCGASLLQSWSTFTVKNKSGSDKWIAVAYTKEPDAVGEKHIYPNKSEKLATYQKISPNSAVKLDNLDYRLGYDRDLIVSNSEEKLKRAITKDTGLMVGDGKRSDANFINLGLLKAVNVVAIKDNPHGGITVSKES